MTSDDTRHSAQQSDVTQSTACTVPLLFAFTGGVAGTRHGVEKWILKLALIIMSNGLVLHSRNTDQFSHTITTIA